MSNQKTSFWLSPKGLAAVGLIGAASYFLIVEHRQHLFEYLPFLIILLCPLMHVFMHGGHGHGDHGDHGDQHDDASDQDAYQKGLEEGRKQSKDHQHH